MSRWFRMYDDLLDDPKVQRLPPALFKTWVNLLCVASRNAGKLPAVEDLAFALRTTEEAIQADLASLARAGLIDEEGGSSSPHNWDKRQFKSDADPTAADRQKKKRERDKGETVTRDTPVTSHPPEAESEADTETEKLAAREPEENTAACVRIGQKITDLMGVTNDPRWVGNWSTVSVWLAQGFDEELDIMPTVVATVERFKKSGRKMPGSLKYFSNAIAENHKARQETGTSPVRPSKEIMTVKKGTPGHKAWMAYYRKLGKRMAWFEAQDFLTVPSEYPQEQAA
jgi:hypothetical protein